MAKVRRRSDAISAQKFAVHPAKHQKYDHRRCRVFIQAEEARSFAGPEEAPRGEAPQKGDRPQKTRSNHQHIKSDFSNYENLL